MQFSIFGRYLTKEILISLLAVLAVLLLILVGGVFAKLLGNVVAGKLSTAVLFPLLAVGVLKSLTTLLAVALFLATLITLGRMYKDNEMTALRACGTGVISILRPLLLIALVVAALLTLLAYWVTPWSRVVSDELRSQSAQVVDIAGITPGRFISIPGSNQVVFAEALNSSEKKLESVYLFRQVHGSSQMLSAKSARQFNAEGTEKRMLELNSGVIFEIHSDKEGYSLGSFDRQHISLPDAEISSGKTSVRSAPVSSLIGSDKLIDQAELQWRLSYPVSAILLVLLAIPLSYTTPRKGQFAKLILAILIYVLYVNLLGVGRSWIESGLTPAWLGLWWVHGLLLLLSLILFANQQGWYWFKSHPNVQSA